MLLLFVTEFHAANVLIAAHFVSSSFVTFMSRSEHLKFGLTLNDCDNSCRLNVNIADDELICCVPVEELICKFYVYLLHIFYSIFVDRSSVQFRLLFRYMQLMK